MPVAQEQKDNLLETVDFRTDRERWDEIIQLAPGYDPVETARKGDYFDYQAARDVVDFFHECLHFVEGEVAHQPFILEPWHQCIVGNLFGWKVKATGKRRFREGMVLVGRKNIKTTLGAGIMLYTLFCDGEARAQCYSMAAEKEQAKLCFDIAALMVKASPSLYSRCKVYQKSIAVYESASFFKAISAESYSKHGYGAHIVVSDELHAQPNRDLYDVMKTGMLARAQPIMLHLTTSDFEKEASICNEMVDYADEVRKGTLTDPQFLPILYMADKGDAYDDPKTWAKANPNMGLSVRAEDLKALAERARHNLAWRGTFLRLHCNVRTEQSTQVIPMEDWDACAVEFDPEELIGRVCWGGLDLASRQDICAWVLLFEPDDDDDPWCILPRFFCPRSVATQRQTVDRWPYLDWEDQGFLTVTDGDVIDYAIVEQQVIDDCQKFGVQEAAGDPWNLAYLQNRVLERADIEIINYGQGMQFMSEPTKELLSMLAGRTIAHAGNPVLAWMARGCAGKEDSEGRIKFSKKDSKVKIDGLVAVVMALGLAMNGGDYRSIYENQGFDTLAELPPKPKQ